MSSLSSLNSLSSRLPAPRFALVALLPLFAATAFAQGEVIDAFEGSKSNRLDSSRVAGGYILGSPFMEFVVTDGSGSVRLDENSRLVRKWIAPTGWNVKQLACSDMNLDGDDEVCVLLEDANRKNFSLVALDFQPATRKLVEIGRIDNLVASPNPSLIGGFNGVVLGRPGDGAGRGLVQLFRWNKTTNKLELTAAKGGPYAGALTGSDLAFGPADYNGAPALVVGSGTGRMEVWRFVSSSVSFAAAYAVETGMGYLSAVEAGHSGVTWAFDAAHYRTLAAQGCGGRTSHDFFKNRNQQDYFLCGAVSYDGLGTEARIVRHPAGGSNTKDYLAISRTRPDGSGGVTVVDAKTGSQVFDLKGSVKNGYLGHEMVAMDINYDHLDDLLITEPGWGGGVGRILAVSVAPLTMQAAPRRLSLAKAGSQTISIRPGAKYAGHPYIILGSMSGSGQGIPVQGFRLPIVYDSYTDILLNHPSLIMSGTTGTLDSQGNATATFKLDSRLVSPVLEQIDLTHLAVILDKAGQNIVAVTNVVRLGFTK